MKTELARGIDLLRRSFTSFFSRKNVSDLTVLHALLNFDEFADKEMGF